MNNAEIEKAGKNLQSRFPLLGHSIRMTAVKKLAADLSPDAILHLVTAISSFDPEVAKTAGQALRSLKNKELIAFLCEGIINGKFDPARAIAVDMSFLPVNVSRRCLFLVLTGQFEKYYDLDYEFQYLRAEYQAAPDELQQRIRSVIQQSGDHRLMGLFGEVRKKFVAKELTDHEAELMLEVYSRNRQMEEIFALLFFAPVIVLPRIIGALEQEKWQPRDAGQKNMWDELLRVHRSMGKNITRPDEPEVVLGPVFAGWIETGKKEYAAKPEEEIRKIFKKGDPPEAVSALSALVFKNRLTPADRQFAAKHPHWMVRIAYMSLEGNNPHNILAEHPVDLSGGGEYWLKQGPAMAIIEFLNLRAAGLNPGQLRQLSDALQKQKGTTHHMVPLAELLSLLVSYTLRNTITIEGYQKSIEDTEISI